jgi:hypothetical protein
MEEVLAAAAAKASTTPPWLSAFPSSPTQCPDIEKTLLTPICSDKPQSHWEASGFWPPSLTFRSTSDWTDRRSSEDPADRWRPWPGWRILGVGRSDWTSAVKWQSATRTLTIEITEYWLCPLYSSFQGKTFLSHLNRF